MRHSEFSASTKRPEMTMTGHQHHHHHHHHHHQQQHYLNNHHRLPDGHFRSDLVASLQLVRGATNTSAGITTATYDADRKSVATKMSEHRRSNKPIMEKRRRARINSCLGELKGLILQAMKKDPARHSKLEKADILEMTVKHLQNVQHQQMAMALSTDPTVMTKFRAGFNECAGEVASYVNRIDGVDAGVRQRLVAHLRTCITGLGHLPPPPPIGLISSEATSTSTSSSTMTTTAMSPSSSSDRSHVGGTMLRMLAGLHLVPSRLPNGEIAFVLPHQHFQQRAASRDATVVRQRSSPSTSDMSGDDNDDEGAEAEAEADDIDDHDDDDSRSRTAEPDSVSTIDRRIPSAFTSFPSHSALEPVANDTVTSSTAITMSPTSRRPSPQAAGNQPSSSSFPIRTVDGGGGSNSSSSIGAKPEVDQAQPSAYLPDKMWRPW